MPGLPCDYLRDSRAILTNRVDVVSFDLLSTGRSDSPNDKELWKVERYTHDVDADRTALTVERMHLLGHSWKGWVAIEHAVTHPDVLNRLILQRTAADIPQLRAEMERLRGAVGHEAHSKMHRYEAEGDYTHPKFRAAITLLSHCHVRRLVT